jgi:hypothetical protein
MIENINVSLAGVVSRARTLKSEAPGGKGAAMIFRSRLSHCGANATTLALSLVQSGGQQPAIKALIFGARSAVPDYFQDPEPKAAVMVTL